MQGRKFLYSGEFSAGRDAVPNRVKVGAFSTKQYSEVFRSATLPPTVLSAHLAQRLAQYTQDTRPSYPLPNRPTTTDMQYIWPSNLDWTQALDCRYYGQLQVTFTSASSRMW